MSIRERARSWEAVQEAYEGEYFSIIVAGLIDHYYRAFTGIFPGASLEELGSFKREWATALRLEASRLEPVEEGAAG